MQVGDDAPASLRAGGTYDVLGVLPGAGASDLLLAVRRGASGFRKLCVVKRLRRALASDAATRESFVREGRLAARLTHPNIVSTYDVGEHEGGLYIAMEYLEGHAVEAVVAAMRQSAYEADPILWVRVMSDVLAGLHHVHELRGFDDVPLEVVHGDVGPHTVFVTYEGRVVLLELGAVQRRGEGSQLEIVAAERLALRAPELRDGAHGDRRADVYAVGALLEQLCGDAAEEDLRAIIARATAPEPSARFPTAAAMRDALEQYCDDAGRMLRRNALASLVGVLFDDERRRAQEDVRARLARLDAAPFATEADDVPLSSRKPRLALLDPGEVSDAVDLHGVPPKIGSIDGLSLLSVADIVSSADAVAPAWASWPRPSGAVVMPSPPAMPPGAAASSSPSGTVDDAVSVPAGPETSDAVDESDRETPVAALVTLDLAISVGQSEPESF